MTIETAQPAGTWHWEADGLVWHPENEAAFRASGAFLAMVKSIRAAGRWGDRPVSTLAVRFRDRAAAEGQQDALAFIRVGCLWKDEVLGGAAFAAREDFDL
jgi:hypothetical protein